MSVYNQTQQTIYRTIRFIGSIEAQMQSLRQQLNLQITFNLKDTYLTIAKDQPSLSMKHLAMFLNIKELKGSALQKCVKWNNHNNSLNLTFAEFAALLISKEDRLLAKIVLQRQVMGAIPNFLLEIIKKILLLQVSVHQFCCCNPIESERQLVSWLQQVTDEDGDLDPARLNAFYFRRVQNEEDEECQLFLRYLRTTGNITAQRLRYLWLGDKKQPSATDDFSTNKFNKMSTLITCPSYPTSPKSMLSYKSQKQLTVIRPEFYDCLNRPVYSEDNELRKKKSIQKHLRRIDMTHNLKILSKKDKMSKIYHQNMTVMLSKIKDILDVEKKTQELRVELCLCPDFYPVLFYDTFPKEKNGSVIASNFKDYLQEFGYSLDISHIYLLFRRYSKELGRLNFNGFCYIFDVSESQYNLIEKNRFIECLSDIEITTKKIFFEVIVQASKNESKINTIKLKLLKQCKDISSTIDQIFREYPQGISQQLLKKLYLKYLNIQISKGQIKLLWKKFNINHRNQEYIQKHHLLNEFVTVRINKYAQ